MTPSRKTRLEELKRIRTFSRVPETVSSSRMIRKPGVINGEAHLGSLDSWLATAEKSKLATMVGVNTKLRSQWVKEVRQFGHDLLNPENQQSQQVIHGLVERLMKKGDDLGLDARITGQLRKYLHELEADRRALIAEMGAASGSKTALSPRSKALAEYRRRWGG